MSKIVEYHGRLRTVPGKSYFVGEKSGEIAYPAGCSLFWSSASDKYYNASVVSNLNKQFNAQIVRCAMTAWSGWSDGYTTNPSKYKAQAETVVEAAIKTGIYVIIDWHCEGDNSGYVSQAKKFFGEMAQKYSEYPHVIYEIWNEPKNQTWDSTIRPYCVQVVEEIRKYDSRNLILCGTQTWSQKVEDAAKNPIPDVNLGYVLHFYSNLHGPWLYQNKAKLGVPVFVSEWGTPGQHANTQGFLDWLDANKVPHVSWSPNNKAEPLSYFDSSSRNYSGPWEEKELTATGKVFLDILTRWNGNKVSSVPSPVPSFRIEAETYKMASTGVRSQPTEDVGGGRNVGWINDRSWMKYEVNLKAGKYRVQYRVASPDGGLLRLDYNAGKNVVGTLNVPNTGGWQKWQTVEHTVQLPAGRYDLGIYAIQGRWNLNWFLLTKLA
jgi:endoglucanase